MSIFDNQFRFNDTKLYDLFKKAFEIVDGYINKHSLDFTTDGAQFNHYCPIYEEVTVTNCRSSPFVSVDKKWYEDQLEAYFSIIDEIKEYLKARKLLSIAISRNR